METLLAIVIGALYAAAFYLLLRRSIVRMLFGFLLLSNAINLLIFTSGGLTRARPPIVPPGAEAAVPPFADPLAQALILTAIVIGFGLLSFTFVLIYRYYQERGSDDTASMRSTDA